MSRSVSAEKRLLSARQHLGIVKYSGFVQPVFVMHLIHAKSQSLASVDCGFGIEDQCPLGCVMLGLSIFPGALWRRRRNERTDRDGQWIALTVLTRPSGIARILHCCGSIWLDFF